MTREEIKVPKQELKTGHWIIIDDCEKFIAECSECGKRVDSRMIYKYSYCACGAKMHNGKFTNKSEQQEDKLGTWLEVDTNMYSCDKCNNCFTLVPEDNNISQFNYCPKCGTKMKKGSKSI